MSTIDIGDRQFPAIIHVKRGNELRRYVPERTCHQPIYRLGTWRCPECHAEICPDDWPFCPVCNKKIGVDHAD